MDNVTLIGMPGSGKSTVGVLLAKALGYQFVDTDLLIQQREGALLQDVLDALGVEAFLDLEGEVLSGLACTGTVIAPGGSAVCRERGMARLKELGRVVYLHVPLAELEKIAEEIEQDLQNSMEREISTEAIGEKVMERLRDVDQVAYVRFASVYRQFKDIDTFMTELNKLLADNR